MTAKISTARLPNGAPYTCNRSCHMVLGVTCWRCRFDARDALTVALFGGEMAYDETFLVFTRKPRFT